MWHDGTFQDWVAERDAAHPFPRDEGVTIVVGEVDDGTWDALVGGEAVPDDGGEPSNGEHDGDSEG